MIADLRAFLRAMSESLADLSPMFVGIGVLLAFVASGVLLAFF